MLNKQVVHTLILGEPTGFKIVELDGWVGKAFVVPRASLGVLKSRPEIDKPGVYFLFGKNENSSFENVYIGESESFYLRLENHAINKKEWDLAVVFTGNLDRADVKYLENQSTLNARETNRYQVLNKVQPQENSLAEFKKVSADEYFEKLKYMMAVLGYSLFEKPKITANEKIYSLKVDGVVATGKLLQDGGFMVTSGSQARIKETESFGGWALGARREFLNNGTLVQSGDKSYLFTKDIVFNSPSAGAATVAGMSINGWTAWKDSSGTTLDENIRK